MVGQGCEGADLRSSKQWLRIAGKRRIARQQGRAGGRCVCIVSSLCAPGIFCNNQGLYVNNFLIIVILSTILHYVICYYNSSFSLFPMWGYFK